jgi:hypothetical protein
MLTRSVLPVVCGVELEEAGEELDFVRVVGGHRADDDPDGHDGRRDPNEDGWHAFPARELVGAVVELEASVALEEIGFDVLCGARHGGRSLQAARALG